MDPVIYKASISGNINVLMVNKEKLLDETIQTNHTVLHLASQFGHAHCVEEILKMAPSLLDKPNSRNETALHLAAQNGHKSVCEKLIDAAKRVVPEIETGVEAATELIWMQNKEKDTALHLAARHNFPLVVELFTKEDPHHPHPANDAGESPLYVAASRGHSLIVDKILNNCESPAYDGPQGSTALHGAVISNSLGCLGKLLEWDTSLTKKTDDVAGHTPLHYGAILGYSNVVKDLMSADRSCAYIQDLDGKNTPLHLAATHGHIAVIKVIVSFCPDLWDMVNGEQQHNILHIAMKKGHRTTVNFILRECPVISSVINQRDADGNTPFHMIATSLCFVPKLIDHHPLLDKRDLNNKNMTPLDLVTSAAYPPEIAVRQREIVRELKWADATWSFHSSVMNNQDYEITMPGGFNAEEIARLRKMGDTHMIVAALVATVTFAAGFTMPGGYLGNDGPDLGLAILRKKTAFYIFVLVDTLALVFSLFAVNVYFNGARATQPRLDNLESMNKLAAMFVQYSMVAMLIAFISGTYASLAPSNLAIATCIAGSILSYFVFLLIGVFDDDWWHPPTIISADLQRIIHKIF